MKVPGLPLREKSYWIETTNSPNYPALQGDVTVDVAIVGAGIAGLSTAYFAQQAGLSVAIIDRDIIGGRVTGNTTGKVTSQHNLCYESLIKRFGEPAARVYAEANQSAIATAENIIKKEQIDCDWQRDDTFVFTENPSEINQFKHEAEAAKKLGLPARFTKITGLPFEVAGAVQFTNQAKFHARKFLLGLAKAINGNGSYVFEHTEAYAAHDAAPCVVRAPGGNIICKKLVVATNVPFPPATHAYYAGYEYPLKSYIVAGKSPSKLKGMYITKNGRHLRSILPITLDGEDWLLIGGESHFPGFGRAAHRHQRLADYAAERFDLKNISYRWSTWDYMSNDGMPLIGKLLPWSKHVYTATGFSKWGLSTGIFAGQLLADTLQGISNPWAQTFNANRLSPITSLPRAMVKIIGKL